MKTYEISEILVERIVKATKLSRSQVLDKLRKLLDNRTKKMHSASQSRMRGILKFPKSKQKFYTECEVYKAPNKGSWAKAFSSKESAVKELIDGQAKVYTEESMDLIGEEAIGDEIDSKLRE